MKKILSTLAFFALSWNAGAQGTPCNSLTGSLSSGVLAFYPFGHGSLADVSGSGHNLNNSTTAYPTSDRFGNAQCAYHFDKASGDYLDISSVTGTAFLNNLTTNPFSISLWYKPMGTRATGAYELLIGRNASTTGTIHCPDTWGEWSMGLYDCRKAVAGLDEYSHWQIPPTGMSCNDFQTSITGNWHHLVFVYDGSTYTLYIDNVPYVNGGTCSGALMSGNVGNLILGQDYTGDLDDVIIYNKALTVSEVGDLYNLNGSCCDGGAGVSTLPCQSLPGTLNSGILAFYPFGYGSLYDVSGGSHNLSNPTAAYPTADRSGNPTCAYHFDKANGDFLTIGAGAPVSFLDNITATPFSISLWYRPMGRRNPVDYELLIGRGNTGLHCPDTWSEWSIGLYDCRQAVGGADMQEVWQHMLPGSCDTLRDSITNFWHHLAFIYDGSVYQMYVDNILYAATPGGGTCGAMSANVGPLMMGLDYTGDLDDIIIYNRSLSAAEVNMLFHLPGSCCDGIMHTFKETQAIPEQSKNIRIYPNPSDGHISIDAGSNIVRTVSVYNNTGMLVGTYHFDQPNAVVNINSLASGIYIIKVITDAGSRTERIIKN